MQNRSTKGNRRRKFYSILSKTLLTASVVSSLIASSVPAQAIDFGPSSNYLVRVTPEAKAVIEKTILQYGGRIDARYKNVFDGFLIKLPDMAALALKKIPAILIIEKDEPVQMSAIQNNQSPTPSWGLDRVDQRTPVSGISNYGYRSAGKGSTVYILDTGVFPHDDLKGRISSNSFSAISDGNGSVDCNGHGTHVAATVAGTQYGLAKNATIVPVRVLSCGGSGTYSQVISGLEWMLSEENTNSKTNAVVNMSLGGGASATLNAAVTKLTNSGFVVVAAAGNENTDACLRSPASTPTAITVGATTNSDSRATYSNFGSCVDINAPGSAINSAWHTSVTASNVISGTSMATPHVAAAAAIYLGLTPGASVAQVTQFLIGQATNDVLTGLPGGTVNKLLYISPTDGFEPIKAPTVALKNVSEITATAANILVDVNPLNAPTTVKVEYSTSSNLTINLQSASVSPALIDGAVPAVATAALEQLTPNTTYYFRISGTNEAGTTKSEIGSFKTLSLPKKPPLPVVTAPILVTAYSATLQGMVNPGNDTTKVSFVYGTDPAFKTNTKTELASPADISGGTSVAVSLPISFLIGGSTYYVRLISGNSAGSVTSETVTFSTPQSLGKPPIVTTDFLGKTFSTTSTTQISGSVNPMGQTTNVVLTYGYESSLSIGTKSITVGSYTGESNIKLISDIPAQPNPGQRVWFRFEAANASGLVKSSPQNNITERLTPIIISQRVDNSKAGQAVIWVSGNARASNTRWTIIFGKTPKLYDVVNNSIVLKQDAIEITPSPNAFASNSSFTTSATLLNLENSTTYYYVVKIVSLSGPAVDLAPIMGTLGSWQTLNVGPAPSPTVSPTPSPTPSQPGAKKSQIITFPTILDREYGGEASLLRAEASSKLPISYTTTTPDVCKLIALSASVTVVQYNNTNPNVNFLTCTVVANQPGNSEFEAATSVSQSFKWNNLATKLVAVATGPVSVSGVFLNTKVEILNARPSGAGTMSQVPLQVTSTTPTICTASETKYDWDGKTHTQSTIRARANGTCQISIQFSGYQYLMPSKTIWSTEITGITAPPAGANAPQTIDFPLIPDRELGAASIISAKASSGLAVTYLSMTPSICYLLYPSNSVAVQTVNNLPAGTEWSCTIRAFQAGDDRYLDAPVVDRTFKIRLAAMAIEVISSSNLKGVGPHRIISTIGFADKSKMFGLTSLGHLLNITSATTNICTIQRNEVVDRRGGMVNQTLLRGVANGTCTLKYEFAGTKERGATSLIWNSTISGFK